MAAIKRIGNRRFRILVLVALAIVPQIAFLLQTQEANAGVQCINIFKDINCGVWGATPCSSTTCVWFFWSRGYYCPSGTTENRRLVPATTVNWRCGNANFGSTACVPNASTIWCTQTFACDTATVCAGPAPGSCASLATGTGGGMGGLASDSLNNVSCP